jgi:hypothetical protein
MKHIALILAFTLAALAQQPTTVPIVQVDNSNAATGRHRSTTGGSTARRAARANFMHAHPCPSTGRTSGACPGYVADHIQPLACGGADAPSNLQWQTTAEAKTKDTWERNGCR